MNFLLDMLLIMMKTGEWRNLASHLAFDFIISHPFLFEHSFSWEIDGETVETESDFILADSKITADGDCSHEIKRYLILGRKVMTSPENIQKQRH